VTIHLQLEDSMAILSSIASIVEWHTMESINGIVLLACFLVGRCCASLVQSCRQCLWSVLHTRALDALFYRSALKPISVISAHRSATSRSALRSGHVVDSRSPLRSAHVTFRPASLRFRFVHTKSPHQCKRRPKRIISI